MFLVDDDDAGSDDDDDDDSDGGGFDSSNRTRSRNQRLYTKLAELYVFVAQTTEFLNLMSRQVLQLDDTSSSRSGSADGSNGAGSSASTPAEGTHDVRNWDVDVLNKCLDAVFHLKRQQKELELDGAYDP